jgi:hypothetical protein
MSRDETMRPSGADRYQTLAELVEATLDATQVATRRLVDVDRGVCGGLGNERETVRCSR